MMTHLSKLFLPIDCDLYFIWHIQYFSRKKLEPFDKKAFLIPSINKIETQSIYINKSESLPSTGFIKSEDKFTVSKSSLGVFSLFKPSTYAPRTSLFSDNRVKNEENNNFIKILPQKSPIQLKNEVLILNE